MTMRERAVARPTSGTAVQVKGRHNEHKRKAQSSHECTTNPNQVAVNFQLRQLLPLERISNLSAKDCASSADAAGENPNSCSRVDVLESARQPRAFWKNMMLIRALTSPAYAFTSCGQVPSNANILFLLLMGSSIASSSSHCAIVLRL